jgi:hypothetical protein
MLQLHFKYAHIHLLQATERTALSIFAKSVSRFFRPAGFCRRMTRKSSREVWKISLTGFERGGLVGRNGWEPPFRRGKRLSRVARQRLPVLPIPICSGTSEQLMTIFESFS